MDQKNPSNNQVQPAGLTPGTAQYSDPSHYGVGNNTSPYPLQSSTAYGQAPQSNTTTVVVTQPTYYGAVMFREMPVRTKCQYCSADIVTTTFYETGTFTWVACCVIALIGCYLGCCLVPFCIDGCKDVVHTCPNCRQQVGRYNKMG